MSSVEYHPQAGGYKFVNSFPEGSTHDYTKRYRGHDYIFRPKDDGILATATGWGNGIKPGDFLLIEHSRYQVETIKYESDPVDMWNANLIFAPRDSTASAGEA